MLRGIMVLAKGREGVRGGAPRIMNLLDWAQIALSLVVMLIALYIALSRHPGRGVHVTTRVAGFGMALLGLSYFVGGSKVLPLRVRCSIGSKHTRRWWGYWWCSQH